MKPKLSNWYPPEIKPVRVGWYECRNTMFLYWWNGKEWRGGPKGHKDNWSCCEQNRTWRGLARKPK